MAQKSEERSRLGPRRSSECVCVAADSSEITPPHVRIQVRRIAGRFGVSIARARLLAELAFSHGRRT